MSNEQDTTPPAKFTGMSFHNVVGSHLTSRIRKFSNFATLEIEISGQSITLFTTNVEEAYAMLGAITNTTYEDTTLDVA